MFHCTIRSSAMGQSISIRKKEAFKEDLDLGAGAESEEAIRSPAANSMWNWNSN